MYPGMYPTVVRYLIWPPHYSPATTLLIILGMVLILGFEVWMLVDVLALRKVPKDSRIGWVVGMFLLHPFVALVYLLVRSRYKPVN